MDFSIVVKVRVKVVLHSHLAIGYKEGYSHVLGTTIG
jgi:hypothetical protein